MKSAQINKNQLAARIEPATFTRLVGILRGNQGFLLVRLEVVEYAQNSTVRTRIRYVETLKYSNRHEEIHKSSLTCICKISK